MFLDSNKGHLSYTMLNSTTYGNKFIHFLLPFCTIITNFINNLILPTYQLQRKMESAKIHYKKIIFKPKIKIAEAYLSFSNQICYE